MISGSLVKGDVVVIRMEGRIVAGGEELKLREKVLEHLESGRKMVVLDMSSLQIIDSLGLGELVATYATTMRKGAVLRLAGPNQKVMTILDITRLSGVIDTFETVDAALGAG